MHAKLTVSGSDRYQREIERSDSMNCSSPSRLAHSASIPVFATRTIDDETFDLTMSSVHEPNESPIMHRSRSFETKRPVWARVEAHWARITLDHDRQSAESLPLYQRVKSWLSPPAVPVTFQEQPVVTKVPSPDNKRTIAHSFKPLPFHRLTIDFHFAD